MNPERLFSWHHAGFLYNSSLITTQYRPTLYYNVTYYCIQVVSNTNKSIAIAIAILYEKRLTLSLAMLNVHSTAMRFAIISRICFCFAYVNRIPQSLLGQFSVHTYNVSLSSQSMSKFISPFSKTKKHRHFKNVLQLVQ